MSCPHGKAHDDCVHCPPGPRQLPRRDTPPETPSALAAAGLVHATCAVCDKPVTRSPEVPCWVHAGGPVLDHAVIVVILQPKRTL